MITGTAHTALFVREYEEAIEFYCGKLGFIVVEDTQLKNKRWIRLRAPGGAGSEILLSRAVDDKQRASIGNQTGGRVLFFLHTDDFDSDYARFRASGIEQHDLEQSFLRFQYLVFAVRSCLLLCATLRPERS